MNTTLLSETQLCDSSVAANAKSRNQAELVMPLLEASSLPVSGTTELAGRQARYSPVPDKLHPRVCEVIANSFPGGLYTHQSEAIAASLRGEDVCLATSTSSGKSLIFMATAMHEMLKDPHARILVLYPTRALIQDQFAKWTQMLSGLGMKAGFIDGSVPMKERTQVLLCRQVVLMTPDVAHAWFMSRLNDRGVAAFREHLRLLILDEAHVYDGVFGTNMAFFLRRFQSVTRSHRLICSTATLGASQDFIQALTGRQTHLIGLEQEGASISPKNVILARRDRDGAFESIPDLVRALAQGFPGRFLVFSDSRKAVETLTAASHRRARRGGETQETVEEPEASSVQTLGVMPYRAGYEAADRVQIQEALASGKLRGIVSTSALELGLDIGEIDLVVLLDTPPSVKSFWQRIGRAGRRNRGTCVIIDTRHAIDDGEAGIRAYLSRPLEPNWLYLHNRYAQYTNALCAASEIAQINGGFNRSTFDSLPTEFRQFLEDELNPGVPVPQDLYLLKQTGALSPHHEFPIRSGIEKTFKVFSHMGESLGELSYSQALREAFPGAVYYYMATPYRVRHFNHRKAEITVSREKHYRTKPVVQVMAFPDFQNGLFKLSRSREGFLAEAEFQVSERVTGFKETRGSVEQTHNYEAGSLYSLQPLNRLIHTSGVCWYFPETFAVSEALAQSILTAFCNQYGIQSRDIGIGRFHSRQSPLCNGPVNGICLFDNANGSLRLTERLAENFGSVIALAIETERKQGNEILVQQLEAFASLAETLKPVQTKRANQTSDEASSVVIQADSHVRTVIASGEKALFTDSNGTQEVTVLGCFYTPGGLHYKLAHPSPTVKWTVSESCVEPINGVTKTELFDLMTGEHKAAA